MPSNQRRKTASGIVALGGWRAVGLALILFSLPQSGLTSPPDPSPDRTLKLGLVEKTPAPGSARIPLDQAVTWVRHDYGRFILVRLTTVQEDALRAAGYQVRIFEEPERVGVGPYTFRVPPGPIGLPSDLTVDESRSERGTFLVKLVGPVRDEWLSEIGALGGEILTPIPEFTYLVRFAPRQRNRLVSLPFVEWVGPYHPAFKLSSGLVHEMGENRLSSAMTKLRVLIYRSGDLEATERQAVNWGGEILGRATFDFYDQIVIRISGTRAPDLARLPDVYAVERVEEPQLEDEAATQILTGQIDANNVPFLPAFGAPTTPDWLAARTLDGANVTIGYCDDGVLNTDPTGHLSGRVNESVCGTPGADGHGHFGASDAGGACSHTLEGGTGFHFGLGVAPAVNFINLPFIRAASSCTADDATRARMTVTNNGPNGAPGTVQNNSWGSGRGDNVEDVSYTSLERTFDILTRDADSVAAGNQPLITCFSAGNEGNTTPNAPGPSASEKDAVATLTRPHSAKNILTTGSSSVYRPNAGGFNIDDRSFFSSQGPAMDGRIKPDFMAPGGVAGNFVGIAGAFANPTVNSAGCSSLGDGLHCLSAGTSFATPETAGGSALLVQWWKRFASSAVPSPAMVKALFVNSARDMQLGNTPDLIPNRHEGWGRWNLGNILEPGTPTVVTDGPIFKKTSGLASFYLDQSVVFNNNADQYQIRLVPADVTKPLKATLVWTDAPGAVGSCPSLVNNLDLEVVQNGKVILRGNAITAGVSAANGPADQRNNVEQVIQPSPSGFYTLTVKAVTLAGDGIPANADTTDQDFALVVTNAIPYTGPILSAGSITPTDACTGTGAGNNSVIDPGETVTFSVPLANSGNAAATAVSGNLMSITPGVSILDGSSAYPTIAAGATGNPNAGDTLSIALAGNLACGSGVDLVLNVSTAQGSFPVPIHFDVGSKTVTTQNLIGTTGAVNNNISSPSLFTTPSATAGTVRSVTVDVNITNPTSGRGSAYLFGDYIVELISPQGTPVTLHFNPLPCSSLVTNYPNNRLAQIGTLDAFKGEAAAGVWTLRATSRNNSVCSGGGPTGPCSSATVNSWTLHVTRETTAACTACVSPTPPEVSAPGSPSLLNLDRDPGTGMVTFTWENQGSASDSYRLYQGNISALSGVGVTPSNTAPIQCGIVPATTSFVPAAGDLYFLVAGQKGSGIGPLGEATNPLAFPRSANQTCP